MIRNSVWALLLLLVSVSSVSAQSWAQKMFPVTHHDFGVVARGAKAVFTFELTNLYEEDVHISGVRSSCGCATPTISKQVLKTWEKGEIVTAFNTRSFLGQKNATITVTIDKPYYAEVQLSVDGFIRGDVVFDPGRVEFGEVHQGSGAAREIKVSYAGRSDWRILDVRSANRHFEVELDPGQRSGGRVNYAMLVRLTADAPPGYLQDQLTLVTDDEQMKFIALPVQGRIVPALTVSPASLFLGVLQPGQKVTKQLVIRGKEPFKVLDVKCDEGDFEFEVSDTSQKLHFIPVTFLAGHSPGKANHTIEIVTDLGPGTSVSCLASATVKD